MNRALDSSESPDMLARTFPSAPGLSCIHHPGQEGGISTDHGPGVASRSNFSNRSMRSRVVMLASPMRVEPLLVLVRCQGL